MLLIASATAFAALGAKLYSAVERGDLVWHDLGWELQSGYRYPGAMIAGLLAACSHQAPIFLSPEG